MNKVCLLNPDVKGLIDKLSYPPLGILYIAAVLERHGIDVSYVDFCLGDSDIPDAEIYGIAIHSIAVFKEANEIAQKIKREKGSGVLIVAGGACITSYYNEVLATGLYDIVVVGEGEETFLEIVSGKDKCIITGIAYMDSDKVVVNPGRPYIPNLDDLPFPARHLLPKESTHSFSGIHGRSDTASTTILTSRGCPYSCTFCDITQWGRRYRTRSPSNVVQEIQDIRDKYGIRHFRFIDDIYTLDRKRVIEISKMVMPLGISYIIITRPDCLDLELMKWLKDSGCTEIIMGIESGSEKILKAMNKKETLKDYINAVEMARNYGIKSKFLLLFGFPGEDNKTVIETVRLLEEARPDKVHLSTFIPLPGSDVWNHPEKYGISLDHTIIKQKIEEFWFYWEPGDEKGFIIDYPNIDELKAMRGYLIDYVRKERWKNENSTVRDRRNSNTELFAPKLV